MATVVPSIAIAVMLVGAAVSLAVLVFAGGALSHLTTGLNTFLIGSVIVSVVLAWHSGFGVVVAGARSTVTVVVAAVSAGVAAQAGDHAGSTVAMFVMLAAISSGALLFVIGRFRLGYLVRFVPFPVIGGYVAGTAWLMVKGGMQVMTNRTVSLGTAGDFFTGDVAQLLVPGLLLALLIVFLPGASRQSLVIFAAIVGFHVLLQAFWSPATAEANGWVVGPLPQASGIDLFGPDDLSRVEWGAIAEHLPGLAAVAVIALTATLLNVVGVEYASGEDVDIDHELTASGAATGLAGLFGGTVGFVALGPTVLARQLGASSRIITGAFVALAAVTIVAGPSLVGWMPRFVAGAMIMGPGIALLKRWLDDWMLRGPQADRTIALVIPLVVALVGVLEGVGIGIVLAAGLFIWRYAAIDPVRTATTGLALRSSVDRSRSESGVLDRFGDRIVILRLNGFLFFGTASRLGERVRELLESSPHIEHVVLDFKRVSGADTSAQNELLKLVRRCEQVGAKVRLASIPSALLEALDSQPIIDLAVADLDRTLDLAETDLLAVYGSPVDPAQPVPDPSDLPADARPYFTHVDIEAGTTLLAQGHASQALFVVVEGSFSVWSRVGQVRLRRVGRGAYLGEAGFFAGTPAMATVTADGPGVVLKLDRAQLQQMYEDDPRVVLELTNHVLARTTERLAVTNALVRDLSD